MFLLLPVLWLASCGDVTADDGSCKQTCLDMDDTALLVLAEVTDDVSRAEYRSMCSDAPATTDCEECFTWIQEEAFAPYDIYWDCGCGLTNLAVRQCRNNVDMDRDKAEAALDDCFQTCKDQALDY